MEITLTLPATFQTMTIQQLLENEWLVPKKVRHFLRMRKNILVNGAAKLFHEKVAAGDTITLRFEDTDYTKPQHHLGTAALITPLYEDEHLIIVDKPAGMKTHPNSPTEEDTLLNHLAAYLAPQDLDPYVVHRLDQDTSGAILFAKNPFVLPILGRLLEEKQIYREYQAVAAGLIPQDKLTINKKIGRDRHDRKKRRIDPKSGATAVTHVTVQNRLRKQRQTEITCILETGRTHQIRVHLASINHPLIGDPLYHPKPQGRLMLHAYKLHLKHPFSGDTISVTAGSGLFAAI